MLDKDYLIRRKDKSDHRKQLLYLSEKTIKALPDLKNKWEIIHLAFSEYFSEYFQFELSNIEQHIIDDPIEDMVLDEIKKRSSD